MFLSRVNAICCLNSKTSDMFRARGGNFLRSSFVHCPFSSMLNISQCWFHFFSFIPFVLCFHSSFLHEWICFVYLCVCYFCSAYSTVIWTWLEFCCAKNNKLLLASNVAKKCEWKCLRVQGLVNFIGSVVNNSNTCKSQIDELRANNKSIPGWNESSSSNNTSKN